MTPWGIEPATFRLVAQCFNQQYKAKIFLAARRYLLNLWKKCVTKELQRLIVCNPLSNFWHRSFTFKF